MCACVTFVLSCQVSVLIPESPLCSLSQIKLGPPESQEGPEADRPNSPRRATPRETDFPLYRAVSGRGNPSTSFLPVKLLLSPACQASRETVSCYEYYSHILTPQKMSRHASRAPTENAPSTTRTLSDCHPPPAVIRAMTLFSIPLVYPLNACSGYCYRAFYIELD